MNGKNGGSRGLRRAVALTAVAAAAVLVAACGGSAPPAASSAPGGSAYYQKEIAFAQCMRSHGMPNFPDPPPSGSITENVSPTTTGPEVRAYNACKQLLPRGSTNANSSPVTQQQLNLVLKAVQCLRAHGEPNFPDPKVVNGKLTYDLRALQAAGVSTQSAQFQVALNACRSLIPKAALSKLSGLSSNG